jgi:predicted nucleic acid-binding protein
VATVIIGPFVHRLPLFRAAMQFSVCAQMVPHFARTGQLVIYAYDAYFIVCARAQSIAIITLDTGLKVAARTAGLTVMVKLP